MQKKEKKNGAFQWLKKLEFLAGNDITFQFQKCFIGDVAGVV